MLAIQQNIKCGWTGCSHRFGSEIDMNMHVMMNHMCILDHGEFVMNRRIQNRKRQAEEPSHATASLEERAPEPPAPGPSTSLFSAQKQQRIVPEVQLNPIPIPQAARVPEQKPVFDFAKIGPGRKAAHEDNCEDALVLLNALEAAKKTRLASGGRGLFENQQERVEMRTDQQPRDEEVDMQALEQGEQMQLENPQKLCEVVDEFLERLRPMKQLGFIRQNRTVYCIVCLKYVKSFHECNWRHTPAEDRVAEMWYRRYGPEKPIGKNQLVRELEEIKLLLQS